MNLDRDVFEEIERKDIVVLCICRGGCVWTDMFKVCYKGGIKKKKRNKRRKEEKRGPL